MLTQIQRKAVAELRRLISFENAGFSFTDEQLAVMSDPANRNGPFGYRDAECIREATQPIRDNWIEPILEALLANDTETLSILVGNKPLPAIPQTQRERRLASIKQGKP